MKIAKAFGILAIVAMSAVLFYGFTVGDFFEDGSLILANPWGIVSLVDLYTGFVLFSVWVVYRERYWYASVVWVILTMIFGAFIFGVYILYAAIASKNDVLTFFLGSKKESVLE
jgi:hypothetical protein